MTHLKKIKCLSLLLILTCLVILPACSKKSETGAPADANASRPAVVNVTCPIMGNPIDPKNVPDSLYREYKGKGVGFCCAGCPAKWDALTDEQKAEKLAKAMAK